MNKQDQNLKNLIIDQEITPSDDFYESIFDHFNFVNTADQIVNNRKTLSIQKLKQNQLIFIIGLMVALSIIFTSLIYFKNEPDENDLDAIDALNYGTHLVL